MKTSLKNSRSILIDSTNGVTKRLGLTVIPVFRKNIERKGVFMFHKPLIKKTRLLKTLFVMALAASFASVPASANVTIVSLQESRVATKVISEHLGTNNSLIRSALLNGAAGSEALVVAMREALNLNKGQALTLDAGQITKLQALVNDQNNSSLRRKLIVQGLGQMEAALTSSGLSAYSTDPSALTQYQNALAAQFKNVGSTQSASTGSATRKETTRAQQLGLVNKIVTNLHAAVDRCLDGSCVLTFTQADIAHVKEGLSSDFFRAMLQNPAACMGNWKTENALSAVADGALALQQHLQKLKSASLTTANIEQAEAAFLDGAAQALVELKISPTKDAAYKIACDAFNKAPCNLLIPAGICNTK